MANAPLTKDECDALKVALEARLETLRADLAAQRASADEERISQYAGEVHDRGEESNVDAAGDVNEALIIKNERELRAVRAALARIEDGTYGECVGCGEWIGVQRLGVQPMAMRCVACQSRSEAASAT